MTSNKRQFLFSLGIILLLCLAMKCCGGENNANKKVAETTSGAKEVRTANEEDYQKGIELIKEGKWNKASIYLVELQKKDYKDSEALFNYAGANAVLGSDYKDIDMAYIYASNIADDYKGIMSLEILGFKQKVVEEYNNTTDEEKAERKKEYQEKQRKEARERGDISLEIENWSWSKTSRSYVTAVGQVTNITSNSMKNVMAVVTYKTADGDIITYDSAVVEYNPIMPGQTSPFKVITPYNPLMAKASLEFTNLSGKKITADKKL